MAKKRKTLEEIRQEQEAEAAKAVLEADTNPVVPTNSMFAQPEVEIPLDVSEPEKELTRFDDIRDYYERYNSGKQSTFYLPEELIRKFKAKTTEEGTSITDVVRLLLLEHYFNDKELKDAYQKRIK